jgi:hypothetical protein
MRPADLSPWSAGRECRAITGVPSGERQRTARLDALPTQAQRRAQAGHQLVEGRDRRPAARVTTATPSSRSTSRPGPRRRGSRRAAAAGRASHAGRPARPGSVALTGIYHHALAAGYARGFLVAAGIMLLALVITVARSGSAGPTWPASTRSRTAHRLIPGGHHEAHHHRRHRRSRPPAAGPGPGRRLAPGGSRTGFHRPGDGRAGFG